LASSSCRLSPSSDWSPFIRRLHVIANRIVRANGRFTMAVLASGGGSVMRFQIAIPTLRERAYPFARGVSRRVWVTVGG
jgi:hypothetical protein